MYHAQVSTEGMAIVTGMSTRASGSLQPASTSQDWFSRATSQCTGLCLLLSDKNALKRFTPAQRPARPTHGTLPRPRRPTQLETQTLLSRYRLLCPSLSPVALLSCTWPIPAIAIRSALSSSRVSISQRLETGLPLKAWTGVSDFCQPFQPCHLSRSTSSPITMSKLNLDSTISLSSGTKVSVIWPRGRSV